MRIIIPTLAAAVLGASLAHADVHRLPAGLVIGAILDGKEGAAKGALLGGATGTGAVLATRGTEVGIPSGSRWRVRLSQPLVIG